eukprot:scaffold941_cov93-Skeletonema_dohrnii-CCMP3373.AAC.5
MRSEIHAGRKKVDAICLPVCLICKNVIIGCETMHKLEKKTTLPQKQSSELRNKLGLGSQMPHQVTYDAVATSIRPTNA